MKKIYFLLLLASSAFATALPQDNQWTWMSGDSVAQCCFNEQIPLGPLDVYGTRGVPSVNNKPPARIDAAEWTDKEGNLWMFGGYVAASGFYADGYYGDMWKYNPKTNEWTWVSGGQGHFVFSQSATGGSSPGPRRGALSWTDKDGYLWLMGGYGRERYYALYNDFWRFNPATLKWTWMGGGLVYGGGMAGGFQTYIDPRYGTKGVPSTENFPAPQGHSSNTYGSTIFDPDLTWTDANGKLWLLENVLWRYDPLTAEWTWVNGDVKFSNGRTVPSSITYGQKGVPSTSNYPGGSGAASWISKNGFFWIYTRDELWKYNPATNQWTWVSGDTLTNTTPVYGQKGVPSVNNTPGEVSSAESWTDLSGNFWLLRGDILWRYNPDTGEWTWMSRGQNGFGIYGTKGVASPGNKPGARGSSVSWTDASGNLWLFGGEGFASSSYGYLNDLWKYTITSATTPFITTSLPATSYYKGAMVSITYTAQGSFGPDNLFIAQLSDTTGSFLNPVVIGSVKASTSGAINVTIPYTTPAASGYRIRVVSNLPEIHGSDNGADITIMDLPATSVSTQHSITTNPLISNVRYQGKEVSVAYTATGTFNPTTIFHAQLSDASGSFANPVFIGSVSAAGSGTIKATIPAATPAGTAYRVRVITVAGNEPVIGSDNGTALTIAPQPPYPSVSGSWTWMSGDNVINQPGSYGTKGVPSTENKPGAREGAASWKDGSGTLWLYGGYGYAANTTVGFLNDLWKYNTATREWTWVSGDNLTNQSAVFGTKGVSTPETKPRARTGAAGWADKEGNLWLYGGNTYYPQSYFEGVGGEINDLWKYDITMNQWTWVSGDSITADQAMRANNWDFHYGVYATKGVPSVNNRPPAKTHAITWTDNDGNFWLYSGYAYYGFLSGHMTDIWKFNPLTTEWTFVTSTTAFTNADGIARYGVKGVASPDNKPLGRQDAVGWVDKDNNLWLYGGYTIYNNVENVFGLNFRSTLADLWLFNTTTGLWTWMGGEKFQPPPFFKSAAPPVRGSKGVPSVDNHPGLVRSAVSWTDAAGKFWLLNGDDLWRYDPLNSTWTWVSGDDNDPGAYGTKGVAAQGNEPGARSEAVSWMDAAGKLWLFGGSGFATTSTTGYLNDLWNFGVETEPTTLTTSPLSSGLCAGSKLSVRYTANHSFNPGNVFTVQLSNASGSFDNPISIGSVSATTPGIIEVTIPSNVAPGTGYRIRVVASSPAITGTDNGSDLSFGVLPTIASSGGSYTSPGLSYKYYEGSWTSLPDFGGLTPVATGTSANVSLAPRKRNDNFAFLWQGQITIPAAGTYYFETASDDGSRLYIGDYSHFATPVVNNDGQHAEQLAGGSFTFPSAGTYPIAITYFEVGGAETMKVYWTAPGAGIPSRTLIPDAALSHLNYSPLAAGLTYKYYEGSWTRLPDFGGLTPVATGTVGGVDISPKQRSDHFAFLWEGRIFIPKAGTYQFETRSDDGSRLYIGNYGHYITPVVDNDGLHAMQSATGSYTFPTAGMYPIAVSFFEATGGEGIELYWSSAEAGIPTRTRIPNSAFREVLGGEGCSTEGVTLTASEGDSYRWSTGETTRSIIVMQNGSYTVTVTKGGCSATSEPMVVSCTDNSITQKGGAAPADATAPGGLSVKALPNPSPSYFTLQLSSSTGNKERMTIRLMDVEGRVVETRTTAAGTNVQVGQHLRPGTYIAQVVQGSEKVTLKLVKTAGF
ncbi:T9SS type A sorting domain-containing protein [Flavisolibacter sp. BT320]|nr:T9SS type A sorting domain-containing protein [Flavisolibacter longurius]